MTVTASRRMSTGLDAVAAMWAAGIRMRTTASLFEHITEETNR